jgi:hypothetical protein
MLGPGIMYSLSPSSARALKIFENSVFIPSAAAPVDTWMHSTSA